MSLSYLNPCHPKGEIADLSQLELAPYVLVVDDNVAIVHSMLLILDDESYACIGCTHPTEVLPFLEKLTPSQLPGAILTDLNMPELNGIDLIAAIRAQSDYDMIRLIVMSADSRACYSKDIPGADAYLPKPFEITNLLEMVAPLYNYPVHSPERLNEITH